MRAHPHQNRQGAEREDRLLAFAELPQIRNSDLHDVRGQLAVEQQQKDSGDRIESEEERLTRLVSETNNVIMEFQGRVRDLPDEVARALGEQIPVYIRGSIQTAERNGVQGLNAEEFDALRNQVAQGIREVLASIAGGEDEGRHKAEREAEEARRKAMSLESVRSALEKRQVEILNEERVNLGNLEDAEHPEKVDAELQKFQKREQELQETQSEITKLGTDIKDFHEKASKHVKEMMEPHIGAALGAAATGAAAGAIICGSWNLGIGAIPGAIIGGIIGYAAARLTAHVALSGAAEAKAGEYNQVIATAKQQFAKGHANAQNASRKIEEDGKILSAAPTAIGRKQKEFYVKRRAEIEARQKETEEERQSREKSVVEMGVSRRQMEDHLKNLQERQQTLKKNREELAKGVWDLADQQDHLNSNAGQINTAIGDIEEGLRRLPQDHPQAQALRKQLEALTKARDDSGHGLRQVEQGRKQMQDAGQDVQGQLTDTQTSQIDLDAHDRSLAQTIVVLQESIPVLQQHEGILGSNALELQQGLASQLQMMSKLGNDIGKEALKANVLNVKSNLEMNAARNSIAGLSGVETPSFVSNVLQGTFEGIGHGIKFVVVDNVGWALDEASKWLKKELPVLGHIISFPIDVVSGVVHGVGELCEGVCTLLAHPVATLEGLGALIGRDPKTGEWGHWDKAGEAWAEMGLALISWKEFSNGEVGKGLGKIVLNVLMTVTGMEAVGVGGSAANVAFAVARANGSSIAGAAVRAGLVAMRTGLAEFGSGLAKMPMWILKDLPKEALHTIAEIVKSPLSIYKYFKTPRGAALEASIGRDLAAFGEVGTRIEQFTIGGKNVAEIPGLAGRSAQELASMTGAELIAAGITDASAIREFVHFRGLVQQADTLQATITAGRHAQELRAIAEEAGIADRTVATRVADNMERIVVDARSKDTRYLTRLVDDINKDMPLQPRRAYQVVESTADGGLVAFDANGKLIVIKPDEVSAFVRNGRNTPRPPMPALESPVAATNAAPRVPPPTETPPGVVLPSSPTERIPVKLKQDIPGSGLAAGQEGVVTIENGRTVFKTRDGRTCEIPRAKANDMLETRTRPARTVIAPVEEAAGGCALRVLDNAEGAQVRVAESLLGRELTGQQHQAILKTNKATLTLEAKRDILQKAGFEGAEIDELMGTVIKKPKAPVIARPGGEGPILRLPIKEGETLTVTILEGKEFGGLKAGEKGVLKIEKGSMVLETPDGRKIPINRPQARALFEPGEAAGITLPTKTTDAIPAKLAKDIPGSGLKAGEEGILTIERGQTVFKTRDGKTFAVNRNQAQELFRPPGTPAPTIPLKFGEAAPGTSTLKLPIKDGDALGVTVKEGREFGGMKAGEKVTLKMENGKMVLETPDGRKIPINRQQARELFSETKPMKLPIKEGDSLQVTVLEGKEFGGLKAGEKGVLKIENGGMVLEMPDGRKIKINRPQARALFEPHGPTPTPKGSPALHRQELQNLARELALEDPAAAEGIMRRLEDLRDMARGTSETITLETGWVDWIKNGFRNTKVNDFDYFVTMLGEDIGRQPGQAWKILDATKDGKLIAFDGTGTLRIIPQNEVGSFVQKAMAASSEATGGKPLLRILDNADRARICVAEAVVGRTLTVAEREAVINAHFKNTIVGKGRTLFDAGFDRPVVQALMDTGVTGTTEFLERTAARTKPPVTPRAPRGAAANAGGLTPHEIAVPNVAETVPKRKSIPARIKADDPLLGTNFALGNEGQLRMGKNGKLQFIGDNGAVMEFENMKHARKVLEEVRAPKAAPTNAATAPKAAPVAKPASGPAIAADAPKSGNFVLPKPGDFMTVTMAEDMIVSGRGTANPVVLRKGDVVMLSNKNGTLVIEAIDGRSIAVTPKQAGEMVKPLNTFGSKIGAPRPVGGMTEGIVPAAKEAPNAAAVAPKNLEGLPVTKDGNVYVLGRSPNGEGYELMVRTKNGWQVQHNKPLRPGSLAKADAIDAQLRAAALPNETLIGRSGGAPTHLVRDADGTYHLRVTKQPPSPQATKSSAVGQLTPPPAPPPLPQSGPSGAPASKNPASGMTPHELPGPGPQAGPTVAQNSKNAAAAAAKTEAIPVAKTVQEMHAADLAKIDKQLEGLGAAARNKNPAKLNEIMDAVNQKITGRSLPPEHRFKVLDVTHEGGLVVFDGDGLVRVVQPNDIDAFLKKAREFSKNKRGNSVIDIMNYSDEARLQVAENIVNQTRQKAGLPPQKLTQAERNAVINAHYKDTVIGKGRALYEAGFDRPVVQALMDTGVTGTTEFLERRARKRKPTRMVNSSEMEVPAGVTSTERVLVDPLYNLPPGPETRRTLKQMKRIRNMEGEIAEGNISLRSSPDVFAERVEGLKQGRDIWAERGNHPQIDNVIREREQLASDLRHRRERVPKNSDEYTMLDRAYKQNQERLGELRFYRQHADYMRAGPDVIEVVDVLTAEQMHAMYPKTTGKDWVTPHKKDWPVIRYRIKANRPELGDLFDTARGFATHEDYAKGLLPATRDGSWAFPVGGRGRNDSYLRPNVAADAAATPVAPKGVTRSSRQGVAHNDFRYYERRQLSTPGHPEREFFMSRIDDLEPGVDGLIRTPSGKVYGREGSASRLQVFSPPEMVSPPGSRVAPKSQGYYGREHSVRVVENVGELPVPGHGRTALELQKNIADELFHPHRLGTLTDSELRAGTAAMRGRVANAYDAVGRSILGDAMWEEIGRLPPAEAAKRFKALPPEQYAQIKALKRSMQTLRNEITEIEALGAAKDLGSAVSHRVQLRGLAGEISSDLGVVDPRKVKELGKKVENLKDAAASRGPGYIRDAVNEVNKDIGKQPKQAWKILDSTHDGGLVAFDGAGELKVIPKDQVGDFVKQARLASEAKTGKPIITILDNADAARLRITEEIVGRKLTVREHRAVLKAHQRPLGEVTGEFRPDLRAKAKDLREAGFSKAEADQLMRSGVTGESETVLRGAEESVARSKPKGRTGSAPREGGTVGTGGEVTEANSARVERRGNNKRARPDSQTRGEVMDVTDHRASEAVTRGVATADARLEQIATDLRNPSLSTVEREALQDLQKKFQSAKQTLQGIEDGSVQLGRSADGKVSLYGGIRDACDTVGIDIAGQQDLANRVLRNSGKQIDAVINMDKTLGPVKPLTGKPLETLSVEVKELTNASNLETVCKQIETAMQNGRPSIEKLIKQVDNAVERALLQQLAKDLRSIGGGNLDKAERALVLRETMEFLRDYKAALKEGGGTLAGSKTKSVREVFDLMRDNQRKLVHQTVVDRMYLTGSDHGVGHVLGNDMRLADQIASQLVKEGRMTAREKLLMRQVIIDHDMGYTLNALEGFERAETGYYAMTKDHPLYSGIRFDRHRGRISDFYGAQGYSDMRMAVLDHSNVLNKKGMGPAIRGPDLIADIVAKVDCLHVVAGDMMTAEALISGKAMKAFRNPEMMVSVGQALDIHRELIAVEEALGKGSQEAAALRSELVKIKNNMLKVVEREYTGGQSFAHGRAVSRFFDELNVKSVTFAAERDFGASGIGMRGVTVNADGILTATFELNDAFNTIERLYGRDIATQGLGKAMKDFGYKLTPTDRNRLITLMPGETMTFEAKNGTRFHIVRPAAGEQATLNVQRLNEVLNRQLSLRQTIEALQTGNINEARVAMDLLKGQFPTGYVLSPRINIGGRAVSKPAEVLKEIERLLQEPPNLAEAQRLSRILRSHVVPIH